VEQVEVGDPQQLLQRAGRRSGSGGNDDRQQARAQAQPVKAGSRGITGMVHLLKVDLPGRSL
jgi:hypothetical protein